MHNIDTSTRTARDKIGQVHTPYFDIVTYFLHAVFIKFNRQSSYTFKTIHTGVSLHI